jgi:hypothetical protein
MRQTGDVGKDPQKMTLQTALFPKSAPKFRGGEAIAGIHNGFSGRISVAPDEIHTKP